MGRTWGLLAGLVVSALACATPADAEQMRVDGYFPAGNDEAANFRTIAVEDFSGEDGPRLSLRVADALREVRIDGRPWLSVLVGRFGRGGDAALQGDVRTRYDENVIMLRRNVCVAYDAYNNCQQQQEQDVECLRVTANIQPELRLVGRGGQLVWRYSQQSSRNAEYCPDFDEQPDFDGYIDEMLAEFTTQIRYALAPAHESRSIRVLGGRDELPRPLRDSYRNALRQTERDPAAACAIFASLSPRRRRSTYNCCTTMRCALNVRAIMLRRSAATSSLPPVEVRSAKGAMAWHVLPSIVGAGPRSSGAGFSRE